MNSRKHTGLLVALTIFVMSAAHSQFYIGPGGWVTVKEGGSLMIGTDLHIRSIAGSSGYLVDQTNGGDVTITGDILVERYLTPNEWHNVASPVSNETSDVFTGTDLVFWYNEALILNDWNFGWVWYTGATGGALVTFRGYDVYFYTNPVTINYAATGSETVNTGSYYINVINTSSTPTEIPSHKGWNLVGNPYPSPVDWLASSGWNKSPINDAKYIWDGANDIYTIFLGGGSPIGINGGTRFIPSNQGFWVQAVVPSGNISINNATRVGNITGTPDFYKDHPVDYPMVSLVACDEKHSDEAVIRFIEGTTAGFDINWDASKLYSLNPEVPQVTVRNGKQSFALNTLPEITRNLGIELGFRSSKDGLYTIRLDKRSNLDHLTDIYLKDELLGKVIHLNTDSNYTFQHSPANSENRFKVYFNPYDDIIQNLSPDSWFSVFFNGEEIVILKNTNRDISGEILIFNILGQPVWQQRLNNDDKCRIRFPGSSGYYIVSIRTEEGTFNTRVLAF